jgi:hypothetical protein
VNGFYHCGHKMRTTNTRHPKAGHITRRRVCIVCGHRITTRETITLEVPKVQAATRPIRLPKPPKVLRIRVSRFPDMATLIELYQSPKSLKQIGAIYGVSHEGVRQRLMAAGVEMRAKGRTLRKVGR